MVKMTLTFDEETIETLKAKAKKEGFVRPSTLARYLMLRGLNGDAQTEINEDHQVLQVPVKNYRELKEYVENKKLGDISIFAIFAMERYMSQYPSKTPLNHKGE
jgi:hypothetical protein